MNDAPVTVGGPIRVFISYSHDSPEHVQRVLDLSNRLHSHGVDCKLDQYEVSPSEGWPAWMNAQIQAAQFVLVVCTEVYARRVAGDEELGRGLGARWEGVIITQALYESGGRNDKFLPLIFDTGDVRFVPTFLQPFTRYDVSQPSGYETLYRHLTSQPRVVKPPLGEIQVLPPSETIAAVPLPSRATSSSPSGDVSRTLLMSFAGHGTYLIPLERAHTDNATVLTLSPATPEQAAFLTKLRNDRDHEVGVAFGLSAFLGRVREAKQEYAAGTERWSLTIAPSQNDYGAGLMEMSTSGHSADEIATLRARRILLDESRVSDHADTVGHMNDAMLEVLIRGMNTPLQAMASPLPDLFGETGKDREAFLRAARLLLVLYLRLTGVVEHVFTLDLMFEGDDLLRVEFVGQRGRKYSNADPALVSVSGTIHLLKRS